MSDYSYFSTFSPDGTLKPLAYLKKSPTLGTTALAISNSQFGLIIAHKTTKKIFKISKNSLYTFSGITNDGLYLLEKIIEARLEENRKNRGEDEDDNHDKEGENDKRVDNDNSSRYANYCALDIFEDYAFESGIRIMMNGSRPFGVSALYMTFTDKIHTVYIDCNEQYECLAMSIGERGQSARTVLESRVNDNMSEEEVIEIGVAAMKNALSNVSKDSIEMYGMKKDGCYEIEAGKYFD